VKQSGKIIRMMKMIQLKFDKHLFLLNEASPVLMLKCRKLQALHRELPLMILSTVKLKFMMEIRLLSRYSISKLLKKKNPQMPLILKKKTLELVMF